MRIALIVLLCALVACAPAEKPVDMPKKEGQEPPKTVAVQAKPQAASEEYSIKAVTQAKARGQVAYGLAEDNRILAVDSPDASWKLHYQGDKLIEIKGPAPVEFFYDQGRLSRIEADKITYRLFYDQGGKLIKITTDQAPWHLSYDSKHQLRSVKRGASGSTFLDYDQKGNIEVLRRGNVATQLSYDDKNRLRKFDTGNTHFIVGFWRDNKLSSLSGKLFGQGLTISYTSYPPLKASIIHESDRSEFTAPDTDALYMIVDEYVYCAHVRRLPTLFEGVSFSVFDNYFDQTITDYFIKHFYCRIYET